MSHEPTAADSVPHEPSHPAPWLQAEGFKSTAGRDIFFTAVQSTRMPMVVADPRLPDVPIVFVNDAFLRMTGYDETEVVGRNCRFLQGPDTDRESVRLIGNAVRSNQEITIELLNYRKDGSTFWNALFMTPIRNTDGEVVYFFSSQLDITRRRDAEMALQHAQKMEALGQLTGGIAHDFNNLLQVIMGNVDLARILTRSAEPSASLDKALGSIKEAARKSAVLTQQLLAFARKQQLQGRVINLSDYLDRHADVARHALGDGVSLSQELSAPLWNTRIDPTQAEMALQNLLSNARDALPQGGRVTLRTANVDADGAEAIERGLPRPGRFVMVEVADDGVGIPPDVIGRVMDPFFTTKPLGQGTGLGLSMVYGFAKQSGGIATIQSVVDQGTRVQLYFPAASDDAPLDDIAAPPPVARPDGHERILVVDDRADVADMAASVLATAGYACTVCGNADAALEALGRGPAFNLMLTDLLMPGGMNGVMLAREAQRRHPRLRVLLMTGFADGTPDRWGGQHFQILMKPFAASELLGQVRQALDQRDSAPASSPQPGG